jgi:hypothetical protein
MDFRSSGLKESIPRSRAFFGSSQIDVKARQNSQAVIPDFIRNPAFPNPLAALDSGHNHAGMAVGPFWQDWRFVTLIRDEPEISTLRASLHAN